VLTSSAGRKVEPPVLQARCWGRLRSPGMAIMILGSPGSFPWIAGKAARQSGTLGETGGITGARRRAGRLEQSWLNELFGLDDAM
jgi:hypothetical protein